MATSLGVSLRRARLWLALPAVFIFACSPEPTPTPLPTMTSTLARAPGLTRDLTGTPASPVVHSPTPIQEIPVTPTLPVVTVTSSAETVTATPAPPEPTASPTLTAPAPLFGITREVLRVRAGPGTTFAILGKLARDAQVALLARAVDSKWFQIEYPAGSTQSGWISAEFVNAQGSIETLAMVETAPAPVVVPTQPPAPPQGNAALADAALELFNRTNALRTQLGLFHYEWSDLLAVSALKHSQDMAQTGRIEHTGSDNSTAAQRVAAAPYPAKQVGENIYMGSSLEDAWTFWKDDPPHYANLVHGGYTQIGIATALTGNSTYYTMDLAEPSPNPCAPIPDNIPYGTLPIMSAPTDRPAHVHPDINLGLRGTVAVNADKKFIDMQGATDAGAPQLRWLFGDRRLPVITRIASVYAWDWNQSAPGTLIDDPQVTIVNLKTAPGEMLYTPQAGTTLGDGYVAFVLYATQNRLTLKYTRDDNVVDGYTIHLENVCAEPSLLALYEEMNRTKRRALPALRPGQPLGRALGKEFGMVIRDKGTFMDPRSRKDWWRGQ